MNLPVEFCDRMKKMLGDEYDAFIAAFCDGKNHSAVRINRKKDTDNKTEKLFSLADRVEWCPDGFYVDKSVISGNHPYHAAGVLYFQEPSAMAPVSCLPIDEGDRILDLCAAPGGKTTQAAAKLSGGILVSNEISASRAAVLKENVSRLGFSNVVVTNETPQKIAKKFPQFFDKIIIDAPCSGEGMFRKEEQAAECWSIEHTVSCGVRQKAIIDSAMECLKQGGYMLYSTCTFAKEENEDIISYILENYPYMELQNPAELCMLTDGIDLAGAKRIYPHKVRGEGHFVALMKDTREKKACEETAYKKSDCKEFREFEKQFLNTELSGQFVRFGDNVYLMPNGIDIDKLKVAMPGVHLGVCKKNRFEPSYALAHALEVCDIKNVIDLPYGDDRVDAYLAGECIDCDLTGWTVVCVDSFPLGWGKASGGVLKNHYPKHLRIRR